MLEDGDLLSQDGHFGICKSKPKVKHFRSGEVVDRALPPISLVQSSFTLYLPRSGQQSINTNFRITQACTVTRAFSRSIVNTACRATPQQRISTYTPLA